MDQPAGRVSELLGGLGLEIIRQRGAPPYGLRTVSTRSPHHPALVNSLGHVG